MLKQDEENFVFIYMIHFTLICDSIAQGSQITCRCVWTLN